MLKDFLDPAWTPITAALMTIAFGVVTLYFRWLLGNFDRLEKSIKELNTTIARWLNTHEDLDQSRHEQNLGRFERISVALARIGKDEETRQTAEI